MFQIRMLYELISCDEFKNLKMWLHLCSGKRTTDLVGYCSVLSLSAQMHSRAWGGNIPVAIMPWLPAER